MFSFRDYLPKLDGSTVVRRITIARNAPLRRESVQASEVYSANG